MGTKGAAARFGLGMAAAMSRVLKQQKHHHKDMMIFMKVSIVSPFLIRKSSTTTSTASFSSKLELKDVSRGLTRGLLSSSWWWPAETKGWWLKDTHIFCVNFIVSPLLSALMTGVRFPAAGTKVLAWSLYEKGVHCFDATTPEQGWTKSSSYLGAFLPFVLGTSPCFVEHQDQNGGNNYFLMLVLDGKEDTHIQIQGFLMSHAGDTLQPLHKPLPLLEG
ncbi:hypothetical protein M0R45_035584 [Rubus argutus]|uniref:Uncharacterized protein n=1 Tax=Rubus argutus TaxID=59490 RepID=A0AAW1VXW4_RUBAR